MMLSYTYRLITDCTITELLMNSSFAVIRDEMLFHELWSLLGLCNTDRMDMNTSALICIRTIIFGPFMINFPVSLLIVY